MCQRIEALLRRMNLPYPFRKGFESPLVISLISNSYAGGLLAKLGDENIIIIAVIAAAIVVILVVCIVLLVVCRRKRTEDKCKSILTLVFA